MADFEVMPVGTREAMREAAQYHHGVAADCRNKLAGALPTYMVGHVQGLLRDHERRAEKLGHLLEQPGVTAHDFATKAPERG